MRLISRFDIKLESLNGKVWLIEWNLDVFGKVIDKLTLVDLTMESRCLLGLTGKEVGVYSSYKEVEELSTSQATISEGTIIDLVFSLHSLFVL